MANSQSKLRLYPRGFLGINVASQDARTINPFNNQMSQLDYQSRDKSSTPDTIRANPEVASLYASLIKNDISITAPEFRKHVLLVAISAFGLHNQTNNFLVWFASQFKSNAASKLHSDFLMDTLKFISTGERNMALSTWMALIKITDEGNAIGSIPEKANEFFGLRTNQNLSSATMNVSVTEVVQKWCSNPNGLEDMIVTLNILFGGI